MDENLLLAGLVIPLCSHPVLINKLKHAKHGPKQRSTFWSLFKDRKEFYDLQERVDAFADLTRQSLHYCLLNGWINLDLDKLSASSKQLPTKKAQGQKLGTNLGKLLSGESSVAIYHHLGVMPR